MKFDLQKASLGKRITAWLLDAILLLVLITGAAVLLSLAFGYDGYVQQLRGAYEKYETIYNVDFDLSQDEFGKLTEQQLDVYQQAFDALNQDEAAMQAYAMVISLTLAIVSLSVLFSYLVLELLVPLYFKNGQTLGKKVFGIALMRPDGVRVTPFMMFVRTVLAKYTLETMIPILIVIMMVFGITGIEGTVVLGLLLVIQIGLLLFHRTRSVLHDLIACTVAVDNASQMMFDTPGALLDYQKRIHAEEAANSDY